MEKAIFRTQATVDHDAKSTRIVFIFSILHPGVTRTRDSDGRKVLRQAESGGGVRALTLDNSGIQKQVGTLSIPRTISPMSGL